VTADVIELKLYDPLRHPATWTDILRRGQYVAFAKTVDTGAPCDDKGQPFASPQDATCLLFDGLAEAETQCQQQVERVPGVRFEIFDWTARVNPPLLVVLHPSRSGRIEGNPRGMRLRTWGALTLLAVAAVSFWYDFEHGAKTRFFPTLIGINLVVVAARLFQLNKSYQHAERIRQARLAEHQKAARS
jgi:hypothetical protein